MSLRVFLQGDTEIAKGFIKDAQWLLGKLKTEMSFNSLSQLARTYVLESGEIVRVQSFFGQDTITIESPFVEPVSVEEEIVEVPFIIQLMFFGSDGYRYYIFWDVDKDILLELTDTTTGEVIEQPIHKDDLDEKVAGIAVGSYEDCEDMKMDEHAPSVDWSETSGGVSSLKKIMLFPFSHYTRVEGDIWLGGYKTTLELTENPGIGVYIDDEGRTYYVYFISVVRGRWEWEEDKWFAKVISYDNDLNGTDAGLHDIHTDDIYTATGVGYNDRDYYVSHGKVIYALPNLIDDIRGFCATKTVHMDLHSDELSQQHASGRVIGHLYSPFTDEKELFYDESFDTYVAHRDPYHVDALKEISNFWVDNVSAALTREGKAIIFEQTVIERLYEWNGSPFYPPDPYYDVKSEPTYGLAGRIWVQKDVEKIEGTDETEEAAYGYQWDNFTEINFPAILELVKAHPKHTGQERLFASMYIQ